MLGLYDRVNLATKGNLNRAVTRAKEFSFKLSDYQTFRQRVVLGRRLSRESRYRVPRDKGCLQFDADAFGGTANMVRVGREVFERRGRAVLDGWHAEKGKSYLVNIFSFEDLDENPEVMDFVLNPQLLGALSGYYGFLPELCSIALMLSPPSETVKGSQEAHFDLRDSKHIKVFVPVEDIGPENGPFEYLPRDMSDVVRSKLGVAKKIEDDALFSLVPRSQFEKTTIKAGQGLIVDTTNCLHFGGRVHSGYRLMWFIHFGSFWANSRPTFKTPQKDLRLGYIENRERFVRDEASRLVLKVGSPAASAVN
jgi:hypothetical protein